MNESSPDYIEIDTPWWSPDWVRDNPEKAALGRAVAEPESYGDVDV